MMNTSPATHTNNGAAVTDGVTFHCQDCLRVKDNIELHPRVFSVCKSCVEARAARQRVRRRI